MQLVLLQIPSSKTRLPIKTIDYDTNLIPFLEDRMVSSSYQLLQR
jgi:hypothetical protein